MKATTVITAIFVAIAPIFVSAQTTQAPIQFTQPLYGSVVSAADPIRISWKETDNGAVANSAVTFVLEDLRNGQNTGVPIGTLGIATVSMSTVSFQLPGGLQAGTNYTIRAELGGMYAFSDQFVITAAPSTSTTLPPSTTAAPTTTSTSVVVITSTTTTAAGKSGAMETASRMSTVTLVAAMAVSALFYMF
ncbi:hypothetical protein HDU76_010698 [Blyttiomyces sp. JEL0837]|nr:hypothetical protein HDU76_010698 [Blyttiomyces sp. JEL0837]